MRGAAVRITIKLYYTSYHKSKYMSGDFVLGIKWAQDAEGQKKRRICHGDRGAEQGGRRKAGPSQRKSKTEKRTRGDLPLTGKKTARSVDCESR